jgi:hypothetical protein
LGFGPRAPFQGFPARMGNVSDSLTATEHFAYRPELSPSSGTRANLRLPPEPLPTHTDDHDSSGRLSSAMFGRLPPSWKRGSGEWGLSCVARALVRSYARYLPSPGGSTTTTNVAEPQLRPAGTLRILNNTTWTPASAPVLARGFFAVINQGEIAYREFLGRNRIRLEPGLRLRLPILHNLLRVDFRERGIEVEEIIGYTKDNVPVRVGRHRATWNHHRLSSIAPTPFLTLNNNRCQVRSSSRWRTPRRRVSQWRTMSAPSGPSESPVCAPSLGGVCPCAAVVAVGSGRRQTCYVLAGLTTTR